MFAGAHEPPCNASLSPRRWKRPPAVRSCSPSMDWPIAVRRIAARESIRSPQRADSRSMAIVRDGCQASARHAPLLRPEHPRKRDNGVAGAHPGQANDAAPSSPNPLLSHDRWHVFCYRCLVLWQTGIRVRIDRKANQDIAPVFVHGAVLLAHRPSHVLACLLATARLR